MAPVFEDITDENAPLLLYLDANKRLQVGTWGYEVNVSNAVYVRFGSVVGFTLTGTGDTWGAGDVVFNPTSMLNATFENGTTGWAAIPSWSTWPGTKPSSYSVTAHANFISTSPYHTVMTVKAGFGDVCQLAGYAAENIPAWSELPPAKYRLPTNPENSTFVGYTSGTAASEYNVGSAYYAPTLGSPGYITLLKSTPANQVLPMLGMRSDGAQSQWGISGEYWSSTPRSASMGWNLDFDLNASGTPTFRPSDGAHVTNEGFTVRCVRQTP